MLKLLHYLSLFIMDIKKFILNNKINNDYNKMIQKELDTARKTELTDEYQSLYRLSECDFLTPNININNILNDTNIIEIKKLCKCQPNNIGISGPQIKKILNPNVATTSIANIKIKNYYIITFIDIKNKIGDIINLKHTIKSIPNDKINNGDSEFYTLLLNNTIFYINKKNYKYASHAIINNNDTLDRIMLIDNEIYISGMFILEFYKKISNYDENILDPFYKYPEDILNIYDRSFGLMDIKNIIDMADADELNIIDKIKIENSLILYNDQKYNVLEYSMIRMIEDQNPVILYSLRSIILYLLQFSFLRPVFFVAKLIGFDKKYPGMYDSIVNIKNKINIDSNVDTSNLLSTYHIDMYILNYLIKLDDVDLFIEYVTYMGVVKKFKKEKSKTSDKIIDWIIEYRSSKIINTLFDCDVLNKYYKFKIIFLTEEFELLDNYFITYINNYINSNVKIDDEIDEKINDTIDDHLDDKLDDQLDGQLDNKLDGQLDNKLDDQLDGHKNRLDSETQLIILNLLDDIIQKGLTRSFYVTTIFCPYILKNEYQTKKMKSNKGGLIHTICKDNASDILEIMIKLEPKLVDDLDEEKRSPLMKYSELGLTKCINKLILFNADCELIDNKGDTFIHKLCKFGYHNILQNTIRNVINIINIRNNELMTPAIVASYYGHEEVFYILKGLNANLDITDIYGNSVYHYICRNKICIGMIIHNHKNKFGFTPSDYCQISKKFYYFNNP